MSDIFIKFVKFVPRPDFEGERGSLVVVVVDEDVEDDGVQQVDPVSRALGTVGQVGNVEVEVEVAGLVVEVAPQLTSLQAESPRHSGDRQLSDVPQEREVVSPQVSQGLQASLVDDGETVQVRGEPSGPLGVRDQDKPSHRVRVLEDDSLFLLPVVEDFVDPLESL